jgi:hypothetical protein
MTTMQVYWLIVLVNFGMFLGIVSVGAIITSFIILIASFIEGDYWSDGKVKAVKKNAKIIFVIGIIMLFITVFIPSKKDIVTMYIVPAVTQNETIKEIPDKLVKLLDKWLEEEKKK